MKFHFSLDRFQICSVDYKNLQIIKKCTPSAFFVLFNLDKRIKLQSFLFFSKKLQKLQLFQPLKEANYFSYHQQKNGFQVKQTPFFYKLKFMSNKISLKQIDFEEENWESESQQKISEWKDKIKKNPDNLSISKIGDSLEMIERIQCQLMPNSNHKMKPQNYLDSLLLTEVQELKVQTSSKLNFVVSKWLLGLENQKIQSIKIQEIQLILEKYEKSLTQQNILKLREETRRKQEQSVKKLYPLTLFFTAFLDNLARQINLFMLVSWIVTIFIVNKDVSPGIDLAVSADQTTFRHWMKRDAEITTLLAFIFYSFNVSLTKLWNSQPQFGEFEKIKISPHSLMLKLQRLVHRTFKIMYVVYEVLLTIGVVSILLVKVYWVLKGFYIFLELLDLQKCSNLVILFCLIKFMLFFTYATYLTIFKGFSYLSQKSNSTKTPQNSQILGKSGSNQNGILEKNVLHQNEQEEQKLLNSMEKQRSIEQKQSKWWQEHSKWTLSKFLGTKVLIYVNFEDFKYLMNKLLIWSLVGCVSELIFWKKDISKGLKATFYFQSFTFNDWMIADSVLGIGILVMVLVLVYRFIKSECPINIWRQEQKGLFYVEMGWVYHYSSSCLFLVGLILVKIGLLVYGVLFFYYQVDLRQCSQTITIFMLAYFVQSIFLLIEGSAIFINGIRAKHKLLRQGDQNSPSETYQMQQSQPAKASNQAETNNQINQTQQQIDYSLNKM